MNYKGDFSADETYAVGDVVVYQGCAYQMTKAGASTPHDVRHWKRVEQPFQEVVMMFHGAFNAVPDNINEEAITLKTDDGEYLITVDDSGDTPELAVTAIEEEEEGAGT